MTFQEPDLKWNIYVTLYYLNNTQIKHFPQFPIINFVLFLIKFYLFCIGFSVLPVYGKNISLISKNVSSDLSNSLNGGFGLPKIISFLTFTDIDTLLLVTTERSRFCCYRRLTCDITLYLRM